jgi:hypothetical protein
LRGIIISRGIPWQRFEFIARIVGT